MIVYKYFPAFDYVIDSVLKNSTIRFTQPDLFNDPFESFPSFAEDKKQKREDAKALYRKEFGSEAPEDSLHRTLQPYYDELQNIPNLLGKSIVSLCLTKNNNNALMWAHYADSYKGLVIGFDSNSSFFNPGYGKAKQGLRKVLYSTKRKSAFIGKPSTPVLESEKDAEVEKYFLEFK